VADDQEEPEASAEPVTHGDEWKPSPFPRQAPAAAPPSRVRRVGRVSRRVAVGLVSLLALGASGYVYVTKDQLQSRVPTTDALTPRAGEPAPPPADDGAEDILLVGSDARTDAQGNALPARVLRQLRTEANNGAVNTDTMILLRVPKNGGKPSAVSVPRDTWTAIPGRGEAKINSAYGIAKAHFAQALRRQDERDQAKIERDSDSEGRRVLVQAVQDLTQVRIDHYAEINLLGFYLLTEALGGVKVCLNHSTEDKDSGANFRRGEQTVSGGEALSFVRQRKNLPRGDLDRIVRQQAFLTSALHQLLSAGTLASPSTLNDLMDAVHRSLTLDPGLDLLRFAQQAKGIASGDLTFATIPVVTANGRSDDGQSIVQIDLKAVREFVAGRPAPAAAQAPGRPPAGGSSGGSSGSGAAPAAAPLLQASPGVPCVN
jgi:LCP family protein required for cell wall assembly